MPTATEMIYKKLKEKQEGMRTARQNELIQKYGENQTLHDPSLVFGQSEKYVEYTRDGKIKLDPKNKLQESQNTKKISIYKTTPLSGVLGIVRNLVGVITVVLELLKTPNVLVIKVAKTC